MRPEQGSPCPVPSVLRRHEQPGDDAETLAARVLREEHRLYPAALNEVARSLIAAASESQRG